MKYAALFLLVVISAVSCNTVTKHGEGKTAYGNWEMKDFVKVDSLNPILRPDSFPSFDCPVSGKKVFWEERNVLNPTAIVRNGKIHLLYRSQDRDGTSRIGLATSDDGLHFERMPTPVFFPDNDSMKKYEWPGGCEDPRIMEMEDGTYLLTYTAYDGKLARLCYAVSNDLINWTKMGIMLPDFYKNEWSKSGALVAQQSGEKIVAKKVNGSYWMYFGDTDLFIAFSPDGLKWSVAVDPESGKKISVLVPRKGYFDSRLVEPGPFALWRDDGIWMIYNASNAAQYNDPSLQKYTYAAGQALFDKEAPFKLVARSDSNFFKPEKPYERIGEVNDVCFLEGLVHFKGKWFLYYGTADSKLAVAVKQ